MKLLIIFSVIACSYAAKLDRTYLPPASAATAGGSPGSLSAPVSGPSGSVSGTIAYTGSSSGTPGSSQSSFGKFSAPTVGSFGQPDTSAINQPTGQGPNQPSALGFQTTSSQYRQPSGETGFGKSNAAGPALAQTQTVFGQTPTSFGQGSTSFGQPGTSAVNQPTDQGSNQPSALGFQTTSSQFRQPSGETGFGKSNAAGPTLAQTSTGFRQTPTSFGQSSTSFGQSPQEQTGFQTYQSERARASIDRNAEILRYDNQNDGETFAYSFETSNGISAEESGVATNGVRAQGGFSYTDDDGQVIRVTYTADENGYQPQGDHLPTPHPIPEEILRSIEENARAAAAGVQEGAYNPDEDVSTPQQYSGVAPAYQGQGRVVSQNAYSQAQGQSPVSQFGSSSVGSEGSRNTPSAGFHSFQGYDKPEQSAPGFAQSGQRLTQSGYQYSQPQASGQFGRPSASSSQTAGQYRPESVPSGQPQGSFPGASPKGFAPLGSNGQTSVGPSSGFPSNGLPKGSAVEPGFGPATGFGQSPSAPTFLGSGKYQPSQSEPGSSMPAQSSPYQYNRPGQNTGAPQQTGSKPVFGPKGDQGTPTQNFGAPRQPPSFTDEEGYKY